MMKYNIENNLDVLNQLFPSVKEVFDLNFLKNLKEGVTNLNEEEYCIKTNYQMRNIDEQFFESHKKYVDIHITLSGSELFAITNIDNLDKASNYDLVNDVIIYDKNNKIDLLKVSRVGDVVVFYPKDGHMTSIGDIQDSVHKVIVKVLNENFNN